MTFVAMQEGCLITHITLEPLAYPIRCDCGCREASLLQVLHIRKPQRAAETATAELCRSKGEMVRVKSNRFKTSPCSIYGDVFDLFDLALTVSPLDRHSSAVAVSAAH